MLLLLLPAARQGPAARPRRGSQPHLELLSIGLYLPVVDGHEGLDRGLGK